MLYVVISINIILMYTKKITVTICYLSLIIKFLFYWLCFFPKSFFPSTIKDINYWDKQNCNTNSIYITPLSPIFMLSHAHTWIHHWNREEGEIQIFLIVFVYECCNYKKIVHRYHFLVIYRRRGWYNIYLMFIKSSQIISFDILELKLLSYAVV